MRPVVDLLIGAMVDVVRTRFSSSNTEVLKQGSILAQVKGERRIGKSIDGSCRLFPPEGTDSDVGFPKLNSLS